MKDLLKRLGTFSTSVLFISMISIAAYALTPTAFWKKNCHFPWKLSEATKESQSLLIGGEATPTGLYFKPDGTKLYVIGSDSTTIYQYNLSTAWDVSTSAIDVSSFNVSGEEWSPTGLFFKSDGTKFYVIGYDSDSIHQYSLSTAWDLSTATYDNINFSVALESGQPTDFFFKDDGTKFYIIETDSLRVYQYSLSIAWDMSTASFDNISFSVISQEWNNPTGIHFNSDGTQMYIVGKQTDIIFQYNLSTAWDISTSSYANKLFDISTNDTVPEALFFNSDGTKLYMIGASSQSVYQYSLAVAWDLRPFSAQSFKFAKEEPSPNTSFFNSDGTKLYIIGTTNDSVYQYTLTTAWDISTATYDNISFSVSTEDNSPSDMFFKSDGTKLYIIGSISDSVHQYTLTTAWDISTATYDNISFSVSAEDTSPLSLFFTSDGTKLYIIGPSSDSVHQYTLTTAWDISTATYDNISFSVSTEDNIPRDMFFKSDGTKLYIIGSSSDSVHQYTLTTAWDISTATYNNISLDVAGTPDPKGSFLKDDGAKMYIISTHTKSIHQYSLSTAWDTSTAIDDNVSIYIGSEEFSPEDLYIKADGTKLYIIGSNGEEVNQYTLSTAWDLSTANYDGVNFKITTEDARPKGLYFKSDGTKFYVTGQDTSSIYQYTLSTAWDLSTASYDNISFSVSSQATWPSGVFFKPDGTAFYITEKSGRNEVHRYSLSTPWDLSTASYDNISLIINSLDTDIEGLHFTPDGTKLYVIGSISDSIYQIELDNNWDIFKELSVENSFYLLELEYQPDGLTFKPDGTKVYVIGKQTDKVYQFTLSTAWDISTATYDNINFSVAPEETSPSDLYFKSDGNKLYVTGSSSDSVHQYTLTTAWNLSTASYDNINYSISTENTFPQGLQFKSDGTKLYTNSTAAIYQYSLSTAWDLSTITYDNISFDTSLQDWYSTGFFFKPDGSRLYLAGAGYDKVYQYKLTIPWDLSTLFYDNVSHDVITDDAWPEGIYLKNDGTKLYMIGQRSDKVHQYNVLATCN